MHVFLFLQKSLNQLLLYSKFNIKIYIMPSDFTFHFLSISWACCPQVSCGERKFHRQLLRKCSQKALKSGCRNQYLCHYACNVAYHCYQPKTYYFPHKTMEKFVYRSEAFKSCSVSMTSYGMCPKKKIIRSCLSYLSLKGK